MHRFVYQEWDIMRERQTLPEERLEKILPMQSLNQSFAVKLQEARIRNRLTIAELAQKVNVSPHAMSMYENGAEMPSTTLCNEITKLLGIG